MFKREWKRPINTVCTSGTDLQYKESEYVTESITLELDSRGKTENELILLPAAETIIWQHH